MNTKLLSACGMALLCTQLLSPRATVADETAVTDDWTIEITPAAKLPLENNVNVVSGGGDATDPSAIKVADYKRIYNAIPFQRAEYNGNPTYRHDSAMEILTGNPRHQTIVRHNSRPERVRKTTISTAPYRYNNPRWGGNRSYYYRYWNYRGLY